MKTYEPRVVEYRDLDADVVAVADSAGKFWRAAVLELGGLDDVVRRRGNVTRGKDQDVFRGYESGRRDWGSDDWWCEPWRNVKQRVLDRTGAPGLVDLIQKSKARASAAATHEARWELSVAGYYPIVPIALAGDPACMRVKSQRQSSGAPIRVFVGLCMSAVIGNREFTKYMSDVAAMVSCIAEHRAVELWAYSGTYATVGAAFVCFPIEFTYGDPHGLAVMCDQSFIRSGLYGIACDFGFEGSYAWNSKDATQDTELARCIMNLDEEDLVLPPLLQRHSIQESVDMVTKLAAASGVNMEWSNSA